MSESFTIFDATNAGKRVCGECQLCCRVLPVRAIDKPGWQKCQHQRVRKGCMVYHKLAYVSPECSLWSCRWLTGQDTTGMKRPDHAHYVIDVMPDMISTSDEGGDHEHVVLQVWVDPAFPDAHRDPALRAWIERRAETDRMATIVRLNYGLAVLIVAPCLASDRQWHEQTIIISVNGSGNRFVDKLAEGMRA